MECYPLKAQFRPGDLIQIAVEPPAGSVEIRAVIREYFRDVAEIAAPAGQILTWAPPSGRTGAFGVACAAYDATGGPTGTGETAFDVTHHWYDAPRFGFMTDFPVGETLTESQRRLDLLCRLHINCLHFYDWFYSHHQYLPPEENFVDSLGRELSLITVRRKIRLAHKAGMAALAYGPLYAAEESFAMAHPQWALYRSDGVPFNVARLFYIMDFRLQSPWTEHILREYVAALTELDFDGIQIDQYGYPKRALPYPGEMGQRSLDLGDLFLPFIELAQATIAQVRPKARVVFHAVNNWPLRKLAAGPQVANYIQVFAPHETYRDLRDLIAGARALAPAKPVVLAAYLTCFRETEAALAERTLRLLTAVIHAAGGYQMILGEGEGVLAEGYFPHYARLSPEGLAAMRRYCDFTVRYGPLLHAPPEEEVSETHCGGVTALFDFGGAPTSPAPRPGAVWTMIREHPALTSINLVNLTGTRSGRWNEAQPPPQAVAQLTVTCKVLEPVEAVYVASPDEGSTGMRPVPFTLEPDPHSGHLLFFALPPLQIWSLILILPRTPTSERRS